MVHEWYEKGDIKNKYYLQRFCMTAPAVHIVVCLRHVGRRDSWLPGNPPFGLKSGWDRLHAARSCECYWVQERIQYTTMDTRVGDTNGAPGFTSICSSLAEPGLVREGVTRQATSAAPRIPLASVYAI